MTKIITHLSLRQEKGLRGSIKKWEKIAYENGIDVGTSNCPLCELYHETWCNTCPVQKFTGFPFCQHTPFQIWVRHQHGKHDGGTLKVYCEQCQSLAEAEINFLKSLLEIQEKEK